MPYREPMFLNVSKYLIFINLVLHNFTWVPWKQNHGIVTYRFLQFHADTFPHWQGPRNMRVYCMLPIRVHMLKCRRPYVIAHLRKKSLKACNGITLVACNTTLDALYLRRLQCLDLILCAWLPPSSYVCDKCKWKQWAQEPSSWMNKWNDKTLRLMANGAK